MKGYRSYFDHVRVTPDQHQRLMEALESGQPARCRRPKYLGYAAAVACCALALLVGFGAARSLPGPAASLASSPGDGAALPPETVQPVGSPAAAESPVPSTEADTQKQAYTLIVEDPFDGQPHGDFALFGVEFTECQPGREIFADAAPAFEQFIAGLSAEDIIHMLGGTDEVPWPLYWAGFGLTGIGYFDEQEQLTRAVIQGEREETTIALTLSPGAIPFTDVLYGGVEAQEYAGTGKMVKAFFIDMENGLYYYSAEFMSGDTGARFDVTGPSPEEAAYLIDCVLRWGVSWEGEHSFTTEGVALNRDAIQEEGRFLTLEEAYAEALGAYLPKPVRGFTVDSAQFYRWCLPEGNQAIERLWANWYRGYDYVMVTVNRYPAHYKMPAPDFSAGEVTPEALEALGSYVDNDAGDTPGWRFTFSVQQYAPEEEGNIVVNYSIKGLTPQEAASLVNIRSFSAGDAHLAG